MLKDETNLFLFLVCLLILIGGIYFGNHYTSAHIELRRLSPPVRPPDQPCPCPPRRPWGNEEATPGAPVEGGLVSPDGTEEIMCPLPASEKKKNVGGSDGSGLCVFTSIEYTARWANERALFDLQQYMHTQPGGGYPEKVDKIMATFAPSVQYIQCTKSDLSLLKEALASGRMVAVTYCGMDMHYGAHHRVPHMVALEHLSDKWAAVSDNNFPGDNQVVWMSPQEFIKRWKGMDGTGWAVILLQPGPTPIPRRNVA